MPKSALSERSESKGFTLVELLVVISIIAILSVIGITIFSSAQKSARDARRRGDIKAIANALEMYKTVNGTYPIHGAISCEANWDCGDGRATCLKTMLAPYMQDVPKDPVNYCSWYPPGRFYKYHSNGDGTFYQLAASLEDASKGTGDWTYACSGNCIFKKTNGGFGYNNQQ